MVGLPAPLTQPYSDNNLINGRMPFDCTNANITAFNRTCSNKSEHSVFKFTKGKTFRLRLMNIGSQGMQRFTIDGMKMKVITQDFVPVVPYETDVVTLGIGQRSDVLVTATGRSTDAIWMRSDVSALCAVSTQGSAKAAIYYEKANTAVLPKSTATAYDDSFCGNVSLVVMGSLPWSLTLLSGAPESDNTLVPHGPAIHPGNHHHAGYQVRGKRYREQVVVCQ